MAEGKSMVLIICDFDNDPNYLVWTGVIPFEDTTMETRVLGQFNKEHSTNYLKRIMILNRGVTQQLTFSELTKTFIAWSYF